MGRLANRSGSSAVMLSMVFMAFISAVIGAILISRSLVIKSECECFGNVWTKAMLSEYDLYLLKDYYIMAYWGNDSDVKNRLGQYMQYSMSDKLDLRVKGVSIELSGTELADPENFRESLENGLPGLVATDVNRNARSINNEQEGNNENRTLLNRVVLDTLPSRGLSNNISAEAVANKMKNESSRAELLDMIKADSAELLLLKKALNNHVTTATDKDCFFTNEWEYVICGNKNDAENFKVCRRRLLLIRNVMNLAYITTDTKKQALITSVSELITPGPAAVLTQGIISEAWALAESESDVKLLLDNKRVPFVKTEASWRTDIKSIICGDDVVGKLDEEARKNLEEHMSDIETLSDDGSATSFSTEGQSYDDYLMIMIALMNDNLRSLRIMDIIQINMKLRYYKDFNFMEYHNGVRFSIMANGRSYEFEDYYD